MIYLNSKKNNNEYTNKNGLKNFPRIKIIIINNEIKQQKMRDQEKNLLGPYNYIYISIQLIK